MSLPVKSPYRHRITLGEARRRAMAVLERVEARRREARDEEARRFREWDAIRT
jgi:hypothetical protein